MMPPSLTPSIRCLALGAVLCCAGLAAQAAGTQAEAVSVYDPYVRLVPPNAQATAVFMRLTNAAASEARIVRAESPAARVSELHTHLHENGVMRMRRVPSIAVPAGGETQLKPGGLHVMLIDLPEALKEGQQVRITLGFADGSSKTLEAPVRKDRPMGAGRLGQ